MSGQRPESRGRSSSPVLRWKVKAPHGEFSLSAGQWRLYQLIRIRAGAGKSTTTLVDLARSTETWYHGAEGARRPNRGRIHDQLQALRLLGLIGFKAVDVDGAPLGERRAYGRAGRIRFWIHPRMRTGSETRARRERRLHFHRQNDSRPPFGRVVPAYVTLDHVRETWHDRTRRRQPPGSRGRRALTGPHRGRRPPVAPWARCPAGHRVVIGRRSLRRGLDWVRAEYHGLCWRCRVDVDEVLELRDVQPGRPLSPVEAADPGERDRRVAAARELLPLLSQDRAAQYLRDYPELAGDAPPPASTPEAGSGSLDELLREWRERREHGPG